MTYPATKAFIKTELLRRYCSSNNECNQKEIDSEIKLSVEAQEKHEFAAKELIVLRKERMFSKEITANDEKTHCELFLDWLDLYCT